MKKILAYISLFFIFWCFCGCGSTKYLPIESVSNDSIRQYNENIVDHLRQLMLTIRSYQSEKDSVHVQEIVYVRDSVVTVQNEAGDIISKERYRDTNKQTDTNSTSEKNTNTEISREYIDSLLSSQKYELMAILERNQQIPVPVEKELSKWQQTRIDLFWYMAGALILAIGFIYRKPILRLIQKIKLP